MGIIKGVRYSGQREGQIKALLRSGPFGSYQFWVGGDRAEPFGPLPVVSTTAVELFPRTIISTGPGPDDWVVCYANSGGVGNNNGINVAFATVAGIVKTRSIPQQSPNGFMVTHSAGNFATHFTDATGNSGNGTGRVYYWNTPDAQEVAPITGVAESGATVGFALPGIFAGLLAASSLTNLWQTIVHETDFSYAFRYRLETPSNQRLYASDGSSVAISPAINFGFFGPNARHFSLKDLILYRHLAVQFGDTGQPANGTISVATDRWQLYPDGTWEALDPITLGYVSSSAYTRMGASYHP